MSNGKKPRRIESTSGINIKLPARVNTEGLKMEITPAIAEKWLEASIGSRNISQPKVDEWMAVMKAGKWDPDASVIQFTDEGKLFNGHHRLWACLLGGINFTSIVLRGGTGNTHEVSDTGLVRHIGHVLQIAGYQNTNQVGAIALEVLSYKRGISSMSRWQRRLKIGRPAVIDYSKANYKKILEAIAVGRKTSHLATITIMGTAYVILSEVNRADADRFFEELSEGANLEKGSPTYKIREQFIRYRRMVGEMPRENLLAILIKGWNAFRAGESDRATKVFSWKTIESFPRAK